MSATGHPSASQAQVGDIIAGRFRITGIVGKGAMGAVYAAEHTGTGQQVALKFMIVDDDEGSEFVARFEQEARVMAGLKHPNTIRIYDFGRTDDGAMFMAMELLEGNGLDRVIRENTRQGATMGESEAGNYGIQILKSLEEAHRQGLVHRDLKPGNIFLTDDGSGEILCKVLDFGIARVQDSDMTNAGRLLGTPSYMSPEQWQGSQVDARSDLYAVGCILYCCVAGGPPFTTNGGSPLQLMTRHLSEPPPDPRARSQQPLSDAFCQVIATAMAKSPEARYADARAMRIALQGAIGGAWAGTPANLSPGTPLNMVRPIQAPAAPAPGPAAHANATMALDGAAGLDATMPLGSTTTGAAPTASSGGGAGKWIAIGAAVVLALGAAAWVLTGNSGGDSVTAQVRATATATPTEADRPAEKPEREAEPAAEAPAPVEKAAPKAEAATDRTADEPAAEHEPAAPPAPTREADKPGVAPAAAPPDADKGGTGSSAPAAEAGKADAPAVAAPTEAAPAAAAPPSKAKPSAPRPASKPTPKPRKKDAPALQFVD